PSTSPSRMSSRLCGTFSCTGSLIDIHHRIRSLFRFALLLQPLQEQQRIGVALLGRVICTGVRATPAVDLDPVLDLREERNGFLLAELDACRSDRVLDDPEY